jgi:hypothetical protein
VVEVREEDDDLLRAAEELGIDLSAGLRRQQADAGELEQAGVHSSALQDVIGAGNEPIDDLEDAAVVGVDLLAVLPVAVDEEDVLIGAEGDGLPAIEGLSDILELDAADIESDDAETDVD